MLVYLPAHTEGWTQHFNFLSYLFPGAVAAFVVKSGMTSMYGVTLSNLFPWLMFFMDHPAYPVPFHAPPPKK